MCLHTIQINKLMKYYTHDENALELALTVEKLYDKDEWAGTNRVNEKINSLKKVIIKLDELSVSDNK